MPIIFVIIVVVVIVVIVVKILTGHQPLSHCTWFAGSSWRAFPNAIYSLEIHESRSGLQRKISSGETSIRRVVWTRLTHEDSTITRRQSRVESYKAYTLFSAR